MVRPLPALCAVAAVVLVSACGGNGNEPPAATLGTAPTTSTTLSVEQEVEAAYLESWDALAVAAIELDSSGLDELYHGRALELVREDIRKLEASGHRGRFEVEHDYSIDVDRSGYAAKVVDRYVNHSVLLNAETLEPVESDPNKLVTETYRLQRIDGAWKVVSITR